MQLAVNLGRFEIGSIKKREQLMASKKEEREPRPVFWGENARGLTQDEEQLWHESSAVEHRSAIIRMRDERRAKELKRREREAWPESRAGQLLKQLGETFAAYRECVMQDPRLEEKGLEFDEVNQRIFNRMKTNIERAHQAARCRYPKENGGTCRAPRVRGKKYCHIHLVLEEARPEKIQLPNLGDARGIHGAIAKGAQAVVDGKLDYKQASILGYYLQLALSNVKRVDIEEEDEEELTQASR
jgi:hypothetical protein